MLTYWLMSGPREAKKEVTSTSSPTEFTDLDDANKTQKNTFDRTQKNLCINRIVNLNCISINLKIRKSRSLFNYLKLLRLNIFSRCCRLLFSNCKDFKSGYCLSLINWYIIHCIVSVRLFKIYLLFVSSLKYTNNIINIQYSYIILYFM